MSDRLTDGSIHRAANEPWYVSTRASQRDRYRQSLRLITSVLPEPKLVYDVGCAQGQFAVKLAGVAQRVVGIDRLPDRIEQNLRAHARLKNLDFLPGDFLDLDLPAGEADLVTALEILYYFNPGERPALLEKASRVLRPGGYLLISTNVFDTREYLSEAAFRELVQQYFNIIGTHTVYRGFYYRFELPLIRLMDEINYLQNLRIFSPHILYVKRQFYPGYWNHFLLKPSWTMDRVLLPLSRRLILTLLKSRLIFWGLTSYGKFLSPARSRSQLIVLAQKKP